MALQACAGVFMPEIPVVLFNTLAYTSTNLTASTHKFAWVGRVWNKDRASKNITKVGINPGAITSAGGSTMRLSLQDIDAATGLPMRGDGTQDQTVDFLASAPTASTWYQTAALSATRTVAFGEKLAVVLEFQAYAGADAFAVRNIGISGTANAKEDAAVVNFAGASWASVAAIPNIILEFDDGTFGSLGQGSVFPSSAITTNTTLNTGSSPDERALKFQVPFPCKLDGFWVAVNPGATARDFSILLSDAGGTLITAAYDADQTLVAVGAVLVGTFATEQTLAANTTYYLSLRPDTASNINNYEFSVSAANHLQALPGSTNWILSTRTDAGAWSDTTTSRPFMGIRISALDDGVQTGGAHVIGS